MLALNFGSSSTSLYGVFDPAVGSGKRRAALIVNPWGWEALRAHRTLRILASRLSAKGVNSLRFDYSGSGDSMGELADVTVEAWLRDIEIALDELQAMTGSQRISLVGLRLGALLAAHAAARQPDKVERIVLWEPPAGGAEFLKWMRAAPGGEGDAFSVPEAFARDVKALDLSVLDDLSLRALWVSEASVFHPSPSANGSERITWTSTSPPCWVEDAYRGAGAVPTDLLEKIVDWILS